MRTDQNAPGFGLPPLIVPVYEPSPKLIKIIDELLSQGFSLILVVDDGSSIDKKSIFDELGRRQQVKLLTHAINLGKGAALKTAFNHLLVHYPQATGAVTVDADGQHLPPDVFKVAQALVKAPLALVLGSRTFRKDVPFRSRFGNIMTKKVFQFLMGRKLEDTQTGLRGIPAGFMRDLLALSTGRYEFELDMLISASQHKMDFIEVPITTVYEENNASSHFNPLLDSLRIYFVFLRFIFSSLVTACTDFVVFTLLFHFSQQMFVSVVIGRACGAAVSFLGSRHFVFRSEQRLGVVLLKFFSLWLGLLGISFGLMLLFTQRFGVNVYLSRVLVDSVLFVFNFLVQRDLIFNRHSEQQRKALASDEAGR